MTTEGQIFNVPEPTGAEQARHETTAADAQINAPNSAVAREVEHNAEQVHDAAKQAASAAQSLGPGLTGGSVQHDAQEKTNAAAAEGKADVDAAKAAGASYLNQVQNLAGSAIATAQSYLPGQTGSTGTANSTGTTSTSGSSVTSQLQSGAATAYHTAKEYVAAGAAAAQPHLENAHATVKPHLDSALATAQPHIDKVKETTQSYVGPGGNPSAGAVNNEKPTTV